MTALRPPFSSDRFRAARLSVLGAAGLCVWLSGSCAVFAAPAPTQVTKPVYVWKTESEADPKTRKFDHCLVKNMYDNGTAVILAQNSEGAKRLALHFAKPKMTPQQQFDLAIQVDRKDVFPVEAIALTPQILTIGIPDALPDQMRRGQMLHVRGPNDTVIYDLKGMEGAIASLQDCMIAQSAIMTAAKTDDAPHDAPAIDGKQAKAPQAVKAPAKTEPAPAKQDKDKKKTDKPKQEKAEPALAAAALPPAPPPEPFPAPEPMGKITGKAARIADKDTPAPGRSREKIIEVATPNLLPPALQPVYNQAGLAPEALFPLKNDPQQPLDYLWQKQSLFVGYKFKPAAGQDIDAIGKDYLKMLKGRCQGNFLAESSATQTTPTKGMSWQLAEAACSSTSRGDSIAAMLFATTPQGAQVFFFESSADEGAAAIKARDAIAHIVTK